MQQEHTGTEVHVPSPLRSYTGGRARIQASGRTLAELLQHVEQQHPGLRFRMIDEHGRIRPHMRVFVNRSEAMDLGHALAQGDAVYIVCALSGG